MGGADCRGDGAAIGYWQANEIAGQSSPSDHSSRFEVVPKRAIAEIEPVIRSKPKTNWMENKCKTPIESYR